HRGREARRISSLIRSAHSASIGSLQLTPASTRLPGNCLCNQFCQWASPLPLNPGTISTDALSLCLFMTTTFPGSESVVDLVEHATIGEVGVLRLLPATKHLIDGEQVHVGEADNILCCCMLGVTWTIVVLRRNALPHIGVEILEIGRGDIRSTATIRYTVDHR